MRAKPPLFAVIILTALNASANAAEINGQEALAEVIVTAQKRSENLQNIPAAVSVLQGADLEQLMALQLTDYATHVAGLQVDSGGSPGQTQITLRGIDANGGGSTVGTYIDDTPLGSSSLFAQGASYQLDLMPYDIERVEVLKGPQGTLYGASTMGGLLKYVMRSPDLDKVEGHVGADVLHVDGGANVGGGARASVNLPIVNDVFGVRVSYFNHVTPGYIDDGATGAKDQNENRQQGGRLAALWQVNSALSLKFSAILQDLNADAPSIVTVNTVPFRFDSSGQPSGFVPGAPVHGDLTDSHVPTMRFDQKLQFYSATVNWDLSWANFISATSYSQALNNINFDLTPQFGALIPVFTNGAVPAGLAPFNTKLNLYKATQEFRLTSPNGGPIEWLVGVFYTSETAPQLQNLIATDLNLVTIPAITPLARFDSPSQYSEISAFGDLTVKLPWDSDITGGLRLARDRQTASSDQSGVLIPNSDAGSSASEDVHTYLFALRHHFDADTMAYLRIASGFRPGGPNTPFPGVPPKVDPDTLVNYELGLKSSSLERKVQVDLAAYYIKWSDIQVEAETIEGVQFETNGGNAKSEGVELETVLAPLPGLNVHLNGAYSHPVLTSDVAALGYHAGDQLALTPTWSGSLSADYVTPLTVDWKASFGAAIRYVGARYTLVSSDPNAVLLPAYHALDLSTGVANERWGIRLYAKNVTNTRGYLSETILSAPSSGTADLVILQPRTIGVSIDAAF
jgi:outer membrane receptor protein involved in Fe transport